ncbi:MAG: xanthine dehydrogenase family protein subunit M [Alphaproteobacteria bacterium]
MYSFAYHRPASLKDAAATFKKGSESRFVAGGHTLLPSMKLRLVHPSDLVDLGGVAELKGIKADGGTVVVGATTPHADVARDAKVAKAIPALAKLAGGIGDPQVRNRGTIGGSLANSDPAADYPAAVLGLGATIKTDRREIKADDYFKGLFETALGDGEIITSVSFPVPEKSGYAKFANPASRYAIVGVFVAKTKDGVRVAVTGAGPCAFRHKEMEKALAASFKPDAVAGIKVKADGLNSDIHASAEYRAHLVTVMAKRAVAACG